jgi:hypothetical protein
MLNLNNISPMDRQLELVTKLKKDPIFIASVEKSISEIKRNRSKREPPPDGHVYKRDWFSRLQETKSLNADYFISQIESIWNKQSQLSSQLRHVIKTVCDCAWHETVKHYGELEEAKENTN